MKPKPFLKWVGGKRQLLPELLNRVPPFQGKYLEPFVGGGALYFALAPEHTFLGDLNQELIDCYTTVRDNVEELIVTLQPHRYEKEYYYKVRAIDPWKISTVERAARMIFLNKVGFNGLYRVNSKGGFNVPFGRYTNPTICHSDNLRCCAKALTGMTIECAPFEHVLDTAQKGDFVYFDPPYIPVTATANFTAYEKSGFGMENQQKLADVFHALAAKGIFVMLSNSDVPWIHANYKKHHIHTVKARRNVNSNASKRGFVGEVIVTNYEIEEGP